MEHALDTRQQILVNALALYPHLVNAHAAEFAADLFDVHTAEHHEEGIGSSYSPSSHVATLTYGDSNEGALRTVLMTTCTCESSDHALKKLLRLTIEGLREREDSLLHKMRQNSGGVAYISTQPWNDARESVEALKHSVVEKVERERMEEGAYSRM